MSNAFTFSLKTLTAATNRLVEAHPWSIERLRDPDFIKQHNPNALEELRHKIKSTSPTSLDTLASSLSVTEKTLLPIFHLEREAFIRHRSLIMVRHQPQLANQNTLKTAFATYGLDSNEGITLSNLLLTTQKSNYLSKNWSELLKCRINSRDKFGIQFIDLLNTRTQKLSITLNKMGIETHSPMANYLSKSIYESGPTAWDIQGISIAVNAFKTGSLMERIFGTKLAYNERNRPGRISITVNNFMNEIANTWQGDEDFRRHMMRKEPEIWNWLKDRLLRSFFKASGSISGNKRYQFWSNYQNSMKDIYTNQTAGRLFMKFGHFGLVEFLQIGNALYVYNEDYFHKLVSRDRENQSRTHDAFKNHLTARDRWTHQSKWERNFTKKLSAMGIYPNA